VSNWVQYNQPVYGIEIATRGGSVRNNLIDSFGEPISVYENGLPVVFENNRVRGVYAPHFIPVGGIITHGSGSAQIISHNGSPTIETALVLGPDLIVRGTTGSDVVTLTSSDSSVRVQTGAYNQTFVPTGGLVVFGDIGNDSLSVSPALAHSATLVGSGGDDALSSGGGRATVTGNAGNDTLIFDDSTNPSMANYTLTNVSVARDAGPGAAFHSVESLVFNPGSGTILATDAPLLAALNVAASRNVRLASSSQDLAVRTFSIASGGVLDLNGKNLVVEYTGPAVNSLEAVRAHLQAGRLVTNTAASNSHLGYGDNAVLQKFKFAGREVTANTILIRSTIYGDTDLDGDVDIADLGSLATQWQTSHHWTGGDFDYDGHVSVNDLGMLATKWQVFLGLAD
jgi:hypothetical protein